MVAFLLVFFSVYGGMHAYVFMKMRAALPLGFRYGVLLGLFMALMVMAPVIVRFLEKGGLDLPARLMAHLGYMWMGGLFLFFSASMAMDVYCFVLYTWSVISGRDAAPLLPTAGASFYVPLAFAALVSVYGSFEAWDIRVERISLSTPRLPEGMERLRVVQVSDVHLGLIVRERRVRKILKRVRAENPDMFVSTGDLVDGQIDDLSRIASLFADIPARYGRYAVTGNHEYYAGLRQALAITEEAGFRVLRGEGLTVGGGINIAGVDYPSRWTTGEREDVPEEEVLDALPPGNFTLLLKHVPLVNKKSIGKFDLQLSGHTHKGQIFPFNLIAMIPYPRIAGLYELKGGSRLYVSRGTGTWGPPVRFLSPPEVTVIDIVSARGRHGADEGDSRARPP